MALNRERVLLCLLVGLCTAPGTFVAGALRRRIPQRIHAGFMEAIVVAGALALLWRGKW